MHWILDASIGFGRWCLSGTNVGRRMLVVCTRPCAESRHNHAVLSLSCEHLGPHPPPDCKSLRAYGEHRDWSRKPGKGNTNGRGWSWTKRICWLLCQEDPGAAIWLQPLLGPAHHCDSESSPLQQHGSRSSGPAAQQLLACCVGTRQDGCGAGGREMRVSWSLAEPRTPWPTPHKTSTRGRVEEDTGLCCSN